MSMNRRTVTTASRKTWIFGSVMLILALCAFGLFLLGKTLEEPNSISPDSIASSFTLPVVSVPESGDDIIVLPSSSISPDEPQIDLPSIFTDDHLGYTIEKVWISKNLSPYPLENAYYNPNCEKTDSNGRLISEHSYVFLSIKIENISDAERDYRLNSCRLRTIDQNEKNIEESELRFCDQGSSTTDPDFFQHTFAAHEIKEFIFGYIFEDENLINTDLLFVINNQGTAVNDTRKYIKILRG